MGRAKKSQDVVRYYKAPESLQGKIRELINEVASKPITDLQYWYHLYILEFIIKKQGLNKDGYVSIDSRSFQSLLGKNYNKFINNLETTGIIESLKDSQGRASYSISNQLTKSYRLTDTFRDEPVALIEGGERVPLNRPKKDISDLNTKRMLADVRYPEYAFLRDNLLDIEIDEEAAEAQVKNWYESGHTIKGKAMTDKYYSRLLNNINKLGSGLVNFKIGFAGRLSTFVITSAKPIRSFIKLRGYEGQLMHSDLTSAHILLAVPLMRAYETTTEGREELDRVIEMIASKTFYSIISEQLRAEGVRVTKTVKQDFIKKVWNAHKFENAEKPSQYRLVFKRLYPTFFEFIESFKTDDENSVTQFVERMTKIESKLFINTIVRRIVTELGHQTFAFTIHDCLVYKEEDREAIEKIMNEEVTRLTGIENMVETTFLREESLKNLSEPVVKKTRTKRDKTEITREEKQVVMKVATLNTVHTIEPEDDNQWSFSDALQRLRIKRNDIDRLESKFIEQLIAYDWIGWTSVDIHRETYKKIYHRGQVGTEGQRLLNFKIAA